MKSCSNGCLKRDRSKEPAVLEHLLKLDNLQKMADSKRQSVGGKVPVATPNISAPGAMSLESTLNACIGAK